ncbi:VOC family protein [Herbidospora sp. NEAU-GS84]|uniref:VOC family protein n=1 Tax=Herbidospora solisilvae TaxID=2696284 RepID=A0A7C9MZ86_9ACTN|nr:VOC family protein [Herbidospora solisilvae]NAS21089.1 VOC family protein [Herbidospora solisilvae]
MIDLIVVYTDRLDECRAFYTGLGLTFEKERHGTGPEHFSATLGSTVFELYPAGDRPPTGRLRLGFTLPSGPGREPGRHTDPDGRTVDLRISA